MEPIEQKLEHCLQDKYDAIERHLEDSASKAEGRFHFDPDKSLSTYIETNRSSICKELYELAKDNP